MPAATNTQVLRRIRRAGVVRPRDLETLGVTRVRLARLTAAGKVVRLGRGLYTVPDAALTEHHSLAAATKRVPRGVVCLLSALRYHDISMQAPFEVWMAIGEKAWRPSGRIPPVRIVRFSGRAFSAGIEEHTIDGVRVRIYGPAKTVADCFKYRNKIGLDVAIEALRDALRGRRCTVDELWKYAEICRVASVIRPYLESLA
jgi:predicted transcriptional regulator of viral defense system